MCVLFCVMLSKLMLGYVWCSTVKNFCILHTKEITFAKLLDFYFAHQLEVTQNQVNCSRLPNLLKIIILKKCCRIYCFSLCASVYEHRLSYALIHMDFIYNLNYILETLNTAKNGWKQ